MIRSFAEGCPVILAQLHMYMYVICACIPKQHTFVTCCISVSSHQSVLYSLLRLLRLCDLKVYLA